MSETRFYIGMGTFEDLLALELRTRSRVRMMNEPPPGSEETLKLLKQLGIVGEPDMQIFIESTSESERDKNFADIEYVKFVITAARIDVENGLCYYWRSTSNVVQNWGLPEHKERLERVQRLAEEARDKLIVHASVRAFIVVRGVVAIPQDLTLLVGRTSVLVGEDREEKNGREEISQ